MPEDQQIESMKDEKCHVAVLFDHAAELEAFLEKQHGVIKSYAAGLEVHVGGFSGKRIASAVCLPVKQVTEQAAKQSIETVIIKLIAGHQPAYLIAAGKACGLTDLLNRYDVLLANEVSNQHGSCFDIQVDYKPSNTVHVGRICSMEERPHSVKTKRTLAEQSGAIAADHSSFHIGETCTQKGLPLVVIRVVSETARDELPSDIEHLKAQQSRVGKVGAFTGALWRNPKSVKSLWDTTERSLEASSHLARFLAEMLSD